LTISEQFFSIKGSTGSTYFTTLLCLESYIVVCHPLKTRIFCTWRKAALLSSLILILVGVQHIPIALRTVVVQEFDFFQPGFVLSTYEGAMIYNGLAKEERESFLSNFTRIYDDTFKSTGTYTTRLTLFGISEVSQQYERLGSIFIKFVIPFFWIVFFNFWIIFAVSN